MPIQLIVTGASKEILEHKVRPAIELFLRERGLELSKEKTRVVPITEGFDFLGQNVRKYGNKLIITPAWKNVQALLDKVRDIVTQGRAKTQEWVIKKLNPVLRGWAMFHRHVCSKETYQWVDSVLFRILWRWARRRHPKKRRPMGEESVLSPHRFPELGVLLGWNIEALPLHHRVDPHPAPRQDQRRGQPVSSYIRQFSEKWGRNLTIHHKV